MEKWRNYLKTEKMGDWWRKRLDKQMGFFKKMVIFCGNGEKKVSAKAKGRGAKSPKFSEKRREQIL